MAGLLDFLRRHRVSQTALSLRLGMRQVTLWRKLSGDRPLKLDEINAILAWAKTIEPDITFEDLFGEEEAA